MKRDEGFSLVENLCMLGIILVLSVVFFRTYIHRSNDIKYQSAREELALLNCALEHYNNACGTYPIGNFDSNSENVASLYSSLLQKSKNFLNGHNWTLVNNMLIDPWGRPYVYKYSGNPEDTYVLFSVGPNGHTDTKKLVDDIYSR